LFRAFSFGPSCDRARVWRAFALARSIVARPVKPAHGPIVGHWRMFPSFGCFIPDVPSFEELVRFGVRPSRRTCQLQSGYVSFAGRMCHIKAASVRFFPSDFLSSSLFSFIYFFYLLSARREDRPDRGWGPYSSHQPGDGQWGKVLKSGNVRGNAIKSGHHQ